MGVAQRDDMSDDLTDTPSSSRQAREQFGRQARFYAESDAHRAGEGLDALVGYAALGHYGTAVDVGTGAGFTAFAVSPYAERVVATDIAPGMLAQTRRQAGERGITGLELVMGEAERLPLASGSVGLVSCRQAAHHFYDLPKAVAEVWRVLEPGGAFIFTDPVAPDDDEVARWMNDVEVRRDDTHIRDLNAGAWRSLLSQAGFEVTHWVITKVYLEFNDWVRRSATPKGKIGTLRQDFLTAPPAMAAAFGVRPDGEEIHFHWDVVAVRAVKQARDT